MKNLLFAALLLLSINSFSQSLKIGNITIDSVTADRYLLDCYRHPDTVKEHDAYEIMGVSGAGMHTLPMDYRDIENQCKDYNHNLAKQSIGKATKQVLYKAHIDTLWDSMWFSGNKSGHSKTYSKIENVPDRVETEFVGWLIPRKTSEADFIKWKMKLTP